MAGAFWPLPPPYTASFPTLVLIFATIGAMGAKEKDAFLLRSYAAANIFWAVLAILYFASMCIWVAQAGATLFQKLCNPNPRGNSARSLQVCTAGTCSASRVDCYSQADCTWTQCNNGVCRGSGKACSNFDPCVDTCDGALPRAAYDSKHFCPSVRGIISTHFFMFLAAVAGVLISHAHKKKVE